METIRACAEGEERFRFGAQNADFKNSPDVCPSSLRFYRLADADLRRIYSALEELSFRLFCLPTFFADLPTLRFPPKKEKLRSVQAIFREYLDVRRRLAILRRSYRR